MQERKQKEKHADYWKQRERKGNKTTKCMSESEEITMESHLVAQVHVTGLSSAPSSPSFSWF